MSLDKTANVRIRDKKGYVIEDAVFIDHGNTKEANVYVSEIRTGGKSYFSKVEVIFDEAMPYFRYVKDLANFYKQGFCIES